MIEFVSQPWHWSISGVMIVLVMFLLLYFGERFGVSSSFRTICSIGGGSRVADYFDYDWKSHSWLLIFILGSIIGGFISNTYLQSPEPVQISEATIADLSSLGIDSPTGSELVPLNLFNFETLMTLPGILIFILGGFLIGFGTRWAGGCTSGHAISGLSNLQLPSLVAVVGFFIGGLIATHFLLPIILNL